MPFGLTNAPATTPIRGHEWSAEQRPLKRGMTLPEPKCSYMMTLPEVPEWRTRVHSTIEKSSGTRRAGMSVPEESTYAPSIRKMISPPENSRPKPKVRQREQTKRSPKRRKQVDTRSNSTIKASQRMDQASGKMRRSRRRETKQVSQGQPRDKRSRRPPKSRYEGFRIKPQSAKRPTEWDHQKSTEVHMSTETRWQSTTDSSLSHRRSNELQKGGWPCWKCVLPTRRQALRDAVY